VGSNIPPRSLSDLFTVVIGKFLVGGALLSRAEGLW
jgi:hypothetical protein